MKAAEFPDQLLVSAFMANVPDHLYFKDTESRFVAVSVSLAHSLGHTVEEVLGKTDFDFFDAAQARDYREAELKIMSSGEELVDRVVKHTWADGRETWSLNVAMPMRNAAGDIVGVFGTNKDITAAKLMEQDLEKANRELREISRTAGMAEIANNVLHNGVETELQSDLLSSTDTMTQAQGFHFSKAVGALRAGELLRQGRMTAVKTVGSRFRGGTRA
jgi:PAS domain S-box-containing protein